MSLLVVLFVSNVGRLAVDTGDNGDGDPYDPDGNIGVGIGDHGSMMVVLGEVAFERDGSGDSWGGGAVVVTAVV